MAYEMAPASKEVGVGWPLSAPMLRRADATKISRRDEESAIPVFMRSLIPSHCSLTRGHLGIGLLSTVRSPSQEWMHEGEMSRLGKWGLIVPAKTAEPSSSINRVNALASASVANIFVSRVRLRCLGRTPRLRSNVTYQVGVIAPSSPVLQHSSLRRFGDDYLAAHEIENVAGHLTCVPAAAKGLVTHKIVLACVLGGQICKPIDTTVKGLLASCRGQATAGRSWISI